MSTGLGASLVLSKGVPAHPCLQRFKNLVQLVSKSESGNALNDVHVAISRIKAQAVWAPGVYEVKRIRAELGEEEIGLLYDVVDHLKMKEDLTVGIRMPRPPPVKDFFSRFEPTGILRDLGTGNGAKADDSGVATVGYEDHSQKAPDVQMLVKPISSYVDDVQEEDVTSTFLSATSSYNSFEIKGDALEVYPDIDYMLKHGLASEREDGNFQCGEYIDKRVYGGEPISSGYEARIRLKERKITYKPLAVTESDVGMKSLGNRVTNNCTWLDLEKGSVATYKYDGRRVTFRQCGEFAYMIDSLRTIKFKADCRVELDLDFELLGKELVLMRVARVGPLRPYDTYQSLQEFTQQITLDLPGFEVVMPELFTTAGYERLLMEGKVDGKVFRKHGRQYLLKHHMSLDFRSPVSKLEIAYALTQEGFEMGAFAHGPGSPVEEYVFKRNSENSTVDVIYKRDRPENKRTDTYKDIAQINWPTTEKKPIGLESQPSHHVDWLPGTMTLERVPV